MVSFDGLRLGDGGPIYQQIVRYLQRGLAAGTICAGDELPSRRVLSALTVLQIQGYAAEESGKRFRAAVKLKME